MLASIANTEIRQALEKGLGTSPLHDMFSKELGISKDEAFIMHWTMLAWFWLHWGQYASTVTNKDIEELTGVVQLFYNNPGVQLVWNNSPFAKPALENDFVDFVEGIISPQNTKIELWNLIEIMKGISKNASDCTIRIFLEEKFRHAGGLRVFSRRLTARRRTS